ncbi:MAG: serine hydrolase [Candidatus Vogelbacteria bacterium]|nr:serine hydrolase [Candidatus Vogelbacteria bacterium]
MLIKTLFNKQAIVTFGLGLLVGISVHWMASYSKPDTNYTGPLREKTSYKLIQPLLACQISNNKNFRKESVVEDGIQSVVDNIHHLGLAKDVSVYFQNFNNGHWTGVNEDELYAPASLNKVSLLIAFLKQAEVNPSILDQKVKFAGAINPRTNDAEFVPMIKGQTYSVKDLLSRLIIYSDNDAKDYLHQLIDQNYVNDIFTDLGLSAPILNDVGDTLSAKSYSLFFRTLYNSTYLNQYMSEAALELLSRTNFDQGLMAGLPATTTVAHKFGHRTVAPPMGGITEELHDCGIVYKPNNPYFVCVMTKGWNLSDLESAIKMVSKKIYDNVQ